MELVWMSRSAIPARFRAARTDAIWVAFWARAAVAVGATVTTPAEMRAMSGTRLTSPVVTTSRRVPFRTIVAGWVCAATGASGSIVAARAAARIGLRMDFSEGYGSGPFNAA